MTDGRVQLTRRNILLLRAALVGNREKERKDGKTETGVIWRPPRNPSGKGDFGVMDGRRRRDGTFRCF